MSNFAERKQARIEAGPKYFKFQVIADFPFDGEILATFTSRKAANEFAFAQRGVTVGNTSARHALFSRFPDSLISTGQTFSVVRV